MLAKFLPYIIYPMKKKLDTICNYILFKLLEKRNFLYFYKNDQTVPTLPSAKHLYQSCKAANVEFLYYNEKQKELHFKTQDGIRAVSNEYFHIFIEIFCNKLYCQYEDFAQQPFVVIDAGANRGYSALYFANNPLCLKVYSYEPDALTFQYILKNRKLNPRFGNKIVPNNYGLSDKTGTLVFYHHEQTDGINSSDVSFLERYDKKRRAQMTKTEIEVRKASDEVSSVISQHSNEQIFLKIDIEGAEYDVLADLKKSGQLEKLAVIFGECHNGFEGIESICGSDFDCVFLNRCGVPGLFNFMIVNKKLNS